MIKSVQELQELIVWAKSQKLKSLQVDNISFEFSDISLLDGIQDLGTTERIQPDLSVPPSSASLPDGNQQLSEDDELLNWSSRP
jgi:hypothetical protein